MLNKSVKPIWLASYPKSGNTWVRLFHTALTSKGDLDFNNLNTNAIISSRSIIDGELGFYSSQIPNKDLLEYRTKIYHQWASRYKEKDFVLCKVHDGCIMKEQVLFPPAITRGVVYVMRNPFDMAASAANHHNVSIERAVQMICNPEYKLAGNKNSLNNQLEQHMGTWSDHVNGWTEIHEDNILILKYENLLHDGFSEFSKFVNYLELTYSKIEIEEAIEKCAFKNIQQLEKSIRFKELPRVGKDVFFRSGKTGGWRHELNNQLVQKIIDCNYETLVKYNYIDASGNVLV